jgi:hypothetical protein
MDMIRTGCTFNYLYLLILTKFPNDFSDIHFQMTAVPGTVYRSALLSSRPVSPIRTMNALTASLLLTPCRTRLLRALLFPSYPHRWPRPLSEPCLRYLRTRLFTQSIHGRAEHTDHDSWFR